MREFLMLLRIPGLALTLIVTRSRFTVSPVRSVQLRFHLASVSIDSHLRVITNAWRPITFRVGKESAGGCGDSCSIRSGSPSRYTSPTKMRAGSPRRYTSPIKASATRPVTKGGCGCGSGFKPDTSCGMCGGGWGEQFQAVEEKTNTTLTKFSDSLQRGTSNVVRSIKGGAPSRSNRSSTSPTKGGCGCSAGSSYPPPSARFDAPSLYKGGGARSHGQSHDAAAFCRCVLKVEAKNPGNCAKNNFPREEGCYNPYAVCAHSTGTSTGRGSCSFAYNIDDLPYAELQAYTRLLNREMMKQGYAEIDYRQPAPKLLAAIHKRKGEM